MLPTTNPQRLATRPARLAALILVGWGLATAGARAAHPTATVTVVVTDAESGQALNQAHLTLQFHQPGTLRSKLIAYSAKTNPQGHCKFDDIPQGVVHLIVTDERHQTFAKDFDVDKPDTVLEIKLKPPHPLL